MAGVIFFLHSTLAPITAHANHPQFLCFCLLEKKAWDVKCITSFAPEEFFPGKSVQAVSVWGRKWKGFSQYCGISLSHEEKEFVSIWKVDLQFYICVVLNHILPLCLDVYNAENVFPCESKPLPKIGGQWPPAVVVIMTRVNVGSQRSGEKKVITGRRLAAAHIPVQTDRRNSFS